ncbi:MAG TPA: hypothetical protein VGQ10_10215 [Vicinamibacterales bacterium]|nr:hypothetical protein [Vicinamibacterales bacterium]
MAFIVTAAIPAFMVSWHEERRVAGGRSAEPVSRAAALPETFLPRTLGT